MNQELPNNTVALSVPSSPKFLRAIRHVMELYIEDLPFESIEAQHLVLAVDEACSNVIKYAYEFDETQIITVTFSCNKERLTITIRDFGKKPDVGKIKPRALDDIRPGGLGTHIIRSVMYDVSYDLSPEKGTLLTLMKSITRAPKKEGE